MSCRIGTQASWIDDERDEFRPGFMGKPSTITLTILCRSELRFRYARKARPYVLLEWYARVDSNHRPFAPEANALSI